MSSKVTINGKTYVSESGDISMVGNKVYIDGKEVESTEGKNITVKVEGDLMNLTVKHGSVECNNVSGSIEAGGSVECKDVSGSIEAGGSIDCCDVLANVAAGGSIECGNIGGNVAAGGSVDCLEIGGNK